MLVVVRSGRAQKSKKEEEEEEKSTVKYLTTFIDMKRLARWLGG
jgi:hypothetical protein